MFHPGSQANGLKCMLDALFAIGFGQPSIAQWYIDILKQIEVWNQIEALENKSNFLIALA